MDELAPDRWTCIPRAQGQFPDAVRGALASPWLCGSADPIALAIRPRSKTLLRSTMRSQSEQTLPWREPLARRSRTRRATSPVPHGRWLEKGPHPRRAGQRLKPCALCQQEQRLALGLARRQQSGLAPYDLALLPGHGITDRKGRPGLRVHRRSLLGNARSWAAAHRPTGDRARRI